MSSTMQSRPPLRRLMLLPVPSILLATFLLACFLWNFAPSEGPCLEDCLSVAPSSKSFASADGSCLEECSSSSSSPLVPESEEDLARKKSSIMAELRASKVSSSSSSSWNSKWWKKLLSDSQRPLLMPSDSCSSKRIYIYKLPSKFNTDILELCDTFLPWFSMCDYFRNSGMGMPVDNSSRSSSSSSTNDVLVPVGKWFQTNQYALDVLFHQRLLKYPCLTKSPEEATVFYVPYYAGLDVLRYHYANVTLEKKNQLGVELIEWLKQQRSWWKHKGKDHVLVLGKITWDFRRNNVTMWGNTLLKMPDYHNMMKLLIERDPWEPNEIGVPHTTYFHPSTDSDITSWISRISASTRKHLISFAGMPRDPGHIRTVLIDRCTSSEVCEFLPCAEKVCQNPEPTMKLFMTSHFCLQPPGDSATRRSVFDSLIAGCIPVLFDMDTAYFQYPWHLPKDPSSYSVYVSGDDVKVGKVDVMGVVASISEEKRSAMRRTIIHEVVPGLLYSQPGSDLVQYDDAFDISVRSVLGKAAAL